MVDTERAVRGLRELAALTSDERGAQRVAWTDTWVAARTWLRGELDGIGGLTVETDPAGNTWATLPGDDERAPQHEGERAQPVTIIAPRC